MGYISADIRPEAERRAVDVVCSSFADIEPETVLRRDVYILSGIVLPGWYCWMLSTLAWMEPEVDARTRDAGV